VVRALPSSEAGAAWSPRTGGELERRERTDLKTKQERKQVGTPQSKKTTHRQGVGKIPHRSKVPPGREGNHCRETEVERGESNKSRHNHTWGGGVMTGKRIKKAATGKLGHHKVEEIRHNDRGGKVKHGRPKQLGWNQTSREIRKPFRSM